ncbi:MAG TPA: molybdenum cofactor biosynthesis protein MoaE [Caulobacteraceae bacterium]|jgi:molybdopterin synthase catalytic subunit|nr:molybdenum cofactor biosynthesis protein MoaE [Caulobacteraceae bacterium]
MAVHTRLALEPFDPARELAAFLDGRDQDGAVVSFTGVMRGQGRDGQTLERLHLDWYPGMTEASIAKIAEDTAARFSVSDVRVVHRCGDIQPGEPIVFAAAAAPHRRAAFEACDYLMDKLKTEAAFWKREDSASGSQWIDPSGKDRADAARWSKL